MRYRLKLCESLLGEIWKPIPNFDQYEVSNFGRVRSYKRSYGYKANILTPRIAIGSGHLRVSLRSKGKTYDHFIHRLVAFAFLDPPKLLDTYVHHKDRNPTNNQIDNLEWSNGSKNTAASYIHRRISKNEDQSHHPNLKFGEVWLIKKLYKVGTDWFDICKMFKIRSSEFNCIIRDG